MTGIDNLDLEDLFREVETLRYRGNLKMTSKSPTKISSNDSLVECWRQVKCSYLGRWRLIPLGCHRLHLTPELQFSSRVGY